LIRASQHLYPHYGLSHWPHGYAGTTTWAVKATMATHG
jgi:hypothetical protein